MPLTSSPSPYNSFLQNSLAHHHHNINMDGKSPRRELQGPRPTPLKVRKDSYKIRKPPIIPQQISQHSQQQQQQQVHRPPVIIYTVSPKVIHTNPNDFMQLVQRLTGPNSNTSNMVTSSTAPELTASPVSSSYSMSFLQDSTGAVSPAARYASIEKIKSADSKKYLQQRGGGGDVQNIIGGVDLSADIDRITGLFPGILSPGPTSLPPIPPNFFSPPSDPNQLGFFNDLSPVLHSSRNYFNVEGNNFVPSPSNNLFSPNIIGYSPTPDLFNNFFDF